MTIDLNAVGTWVGTVVSFAGAYVAIQQARRAKSEANRAETLRQTIEGRVTQGDFSEVQARAATACDAMAKYGPGGSLTVLRGYDPSRDASAVQSLTEALDRHQAALAKELGEQVASVRDRLIAALTDFSGQQKPEDHIQTGRIVYLELTGLAGTLHAATRKMLIAPDRTS